MRSLTPELSSHISGDVTTLAVCWRIERRDGVLILGTEHDLDVLISAGPYAGSYAAAAGITGSNVRSTADMSVNNMEVTGAINAGDLAIVDLTAAEIEAGLFDDAAVTLLMVNWTAPDDGQIVLQTGSIGAINRTSSGTYKTELRGLTQRLSQTIIRTYGSGCDAELGDARCGIDLAALTVTGTVTAVTSKRRFVAELDGTSPVETIDVELFLAMPKTIAIGDTFTVTPGCDKREVTCRETFGNILNFRGHGAWTPGVGEMAQFGGQTAERKPKAGRTQRVGLFADLIDALLPRVLATWPTVPGEVGDVTYNGGLIHWTSGENDTFSMEVKSTVSL
jgi:uncharacterized phage protein (TIGR02218 family)